MNEAFTIGNNNSIYTFGPKIIVCWQAQSTDVTARDLEAGDACLHHASVHTGLAQQANPGCQDEICRIFLLFSDKIF